MKIFISRMIVLVFVLGFEASSVYAWTGSESEWVGGETQIGELRRFPPLFTAEIRNFLPALAKGHELRIDANQCLRTDAEQAVGLNQELSRQAEHAAIRLQNADLIYLAALDSILFPFKYSRVDHGSDVSIRLVALDSVDGPPPCGADGYCNLNACSADPDCPAGLPQQESESEPYESPHDEKGIGGSVWLTTGPDGFEGGHSCDFDKGTCNIKVTWSVQPDKYDKWKICWKDWGDTFTNACDVNQKIRKFENNFYVIPDLKEDHHYRIRLEGRKDSNDKWKCLAKARLRNVHLNGTNIRGVVPCIVP